MTTDDKRRRGATVRGQLLLFDGLYQGVQRGQGFKLLLFCFFTAIFDLVHEVEAIYCVC